MGIWKYYSYKAFIANDSQGDTYGNSYENQGTIKIPFWVRHPQSYIKNKLQQEIKKNKELSQVITISIERVE